MTEDFSRYPEMVNNFETAAVIDEIETDGSRMYAVAAEKDRWRRLNCPENLIYIAAVEGIARVLNDYRDFQITNED